MWKDISTGTETKKKIKIQLSTHDFDDEIDVARQTC